MLLCKVLVAVEIDLKLLRLCQRLVMKKYRGARCLSDFFTLLDVIEVDCGVQIICVIQSIAAESENADRLVLTVPDNRRHWILKRLNTVPEIPLN